MKYIALIALVFASAFAMTKANAATSDAFVAKVQANMLGQYALAAYGSSHASDPRLKSLASAVAKNAGSADAWLKAYAARHHITLANKPSFVADAQYSQLVGRHGHAFDRLLAQDFVVDTQLPLHRLRAEAATHSDLSAFAGKQAQMLTHFLQQAKKLDH